MRVTDLFAGPGGWSLACRDLGLDELGIEWDDAACKTREAAGLKTLKADVAVLDPCGYPCDGLIASPPCQAWSMAGKRGGERDKEHVIRCAHELAAGNDTRAEHAAKCEDARSMLVVEPIRWVRALEPSWVALEQVPPVLELWTLFASFLEGWGYSVWAGVLSAERYGVPQTRKRAILLAHRDRAAAPPMPTHQEYVPGEPAREEHTLEGVLLPWVSMAEALGWDGDGVYLKECIGQGFEERRGHDSTHPATRPAPTLREKYRSAEWVRERPAPTLTTTRRSKDGMLVGRQLPEGEGENVGGRNWRPDGYDCRYGGFGKDAEPRPVEDPAPTLTAQGLAKGRDVWFRNNSNENAGRRRADEPAPTTFYGHASNEVGWVPEPDDRVNTTGVRVSVREASILQGFPPDYPWQGSRTKQFEQVGNAVPPPLAQAVLSQLMDAGELREAA